MESVNNQQTVFVIDWYDRYHDKDKVRKVFFMNGRWWCLKEITLNWGLPILDTVDDTAYYGEFQYYNTLEEAEEKVKELKKWEGVLF